MLYTFKGSPVSYMASPATVVERDLHRERQKLKSEKVYTFLILSHIYVYSIIMVINKI